MTPGGGADLRHSVELMNATTVKARLHDLTHPTGVEDTLSVDFPNNRPFRLAITPPAAIGVAILCALVGVGFIAWHFCASSSANPAAGARLSSPHATVPLVPASVAATTASAPMSVIVAVVGEVDRPGLHTFAPTARVADALAAAQPKPQAQTLGLNLAQKLADGQQIVVPNIDAGPVPPPPSGISGGAPSQGGAQVTGKISLNSATAQELTTLTGVGEKTAQAIIAYRDAHGGFTSIDELQQVKGIGPAKFATISPEVTL